MTKPNLLQNRGGKPQILWS